MNKSVAITVSNLIFQSRVRAAAIELGLDVAYADTPSTFAEALAGGPAVVVVDLKEMNLDPIDAIARAKAAGAGVLAFGPHTDAETLPVARAAGAVAVPRSQFKAELAELLRRLVAGRSEVGG